MKGIWISAIIVAFVAGTIVTGAAVFADDFIFPQPYIRTATETLDPDNDVFNPVVIFLGCDDGDTFVSGSSFGPPRGGATPLVIEENGPVDTAHDGHVGSIDWHTTARYTDGTGTLELEVSVICLDTNNGDETDSIDSTDEDSNSDGSDDISDGTSG